MALEGDQKPIVNRPQKISSYVGRVIDTSSGLFRSTRLDPTIKDHILDDSGEA
jgi:hypothetical protein